VRSPTRPASPRSCCWDEETTEIRQREFISRLYWIVKQNRGLIMSYLAMTVFEPEMVTGLEHSEALEDVLDRLADRAGEHVGRLGHPANANPRVGTRAVIGMILSMGLFDDLVGGAGSIHPTSDEVINEMTQLVLHGTLHRLAPPVPANVGAKGPPRQRRRAR
jgi:hypothetical protein